MSQSAKDHAFLLALGQRLRLLRARRGMTRRLLSVQSGVSERYISAVEAGAGNGSILLLRALAEALLEEQTEQPRPPATRVAGYQRRIALIGLRGGREVDPRPPVSPASRRAVPGTRPGNRK